VRVKPKWPDSVTSITIPVGFISARFSQPTPIISIGAGRPDIGAYEYQSFSGQKYYVSQTYGNNAYDGKAPYYDGAHGPWQTLQYAAAHYTAGSYPIAVYIRSGTYQEQSTWGYLNHGTAANPVVITNYPGESPIIDGNNYTIGGGGSGMFHIYGQYHTVRNFEIRRGGNLAVILVGDYASADNIYAHHNYGGGIGGFADYNVIENCTAYYNAVSNEYGVAGSWGWGISLCRHGDFGNTGHGTVRNCLSLGNWGEGISTFESYYNTIEDNIICNNYTVNLYLSDTQYATAQRNLSYYTPGNQSQQYCTSQNCIGLGDEGHTPQSSDNIVRNNITWGGDRSIYVGTTNWNGTLVAFNTFTQVFDRIVESANLMCYGGAATGGRFCNNVIWQDDTDVQLARSVTSGVTFDHNNWHRTPPVGFGGTGDIIGAPLLAKSGSTVPRALTYAYFEPTASSPFLAGGTPVTGIDDDNQGRDRNDSTPDIGALEYQG